MKHKLSTRTVDCGLPQLSVRTDHKKGAYKKAQRRRQQEHHLKIISCLFKALMQTKCVLFMLP